VDVNVDMVKIQSVECAFQKALVKWLKPYKIELWNAQRLVWMLYLEELAAVYNMSATKLSVFMSRGYNNSVITGVN
jgi:hypothetical protein